MEERKSWPNCGFASFCKGFLTFFPLLPTVGSVTKVLPLGDRLEIANP